MARSPDCIVIGGGVIGLSVARQLHGEGLRVTVVEKHECGREASWAGAGVLAPCNPHRTDGAAILQMHSLRHYPAFCTTLLEETGIDPEYERCGELELLFTPDAVRIAKEDARAAKGQVDSQGRPEWVMLSSDEATSLQPVISKEILGALLCRTTAQVRNPRLLRAFRAACRLRRIMILEHTLVKDLEISGDRVLGVVTETETIHAGAVVLCAGAWSSTIHSRLHELMPVHPIRGQMLLMKLDRRPFEQVISRGKTYLVPRRDGHLLLGSNEEPEAGFVKRNTPQVIGELIERGQKLVPSLAEAPIVGMWSGLRPGTPDDKPYIGRVPGLDGLIAATGHYRSGLAMTPITAEVVAAIVNNRTLSTDLACCRPGRG